MDIRELIIGSFEDYWGRFDRALEGLTSEDLAWQPQPECNPISFIAWHMARVEDRFFHHFAQGTEEVWVTNNWYTQFGLEPTDHGVGSTMEQVLTFPAISPEMLAGYLGDVRRDTRAFLLEFQLEDLDVVPGRPAFPPDTPRDSNKWPMGRMFRQLFGELNQHLGQVDYIRGMIKGFGARISLYSPLPVS
jgi:hypothetical protein